MPLQTHLTSQVKPRPDLQPSRVAIYCKTTGEIAGQTVITFFEDVSTGTTSTGLRSFDSSIDLTGPRIARVTGQVTAHPFDPTSLDFWTDHVPALDSSAHPETTPGSLALVNTEITPVTVLDATNTPVDYLATYPNYLGHQGTVHPWMPVRTIEVRVTAHLTYQRRKNIGTAETAVWVAIGQPNTHEHSVKVKLTNAPAGTTPYELQTLLNPGETYPGGLAQGIYNALSQLQYNFSHTILEQPFTTLVKPGKHALNLSGGAADWTGMQAMIQESTIEFINSPATGLTIGQTSVRCGPVEHLEPGQLVQLFNLFQNRDVNKINPNERNSGLPNGGGDTAMPSDLAQEDTTPAAPDAAQQIFSAVDATPGVTNINGINHDPANGQITVSAYAPGNATPLATALIPPIYTGAGAPSAGNLAPGIPFRVGWLYVDTTGHALYRCTTAGTVTAGMSEGEMYVPGTNTSVWVEIAGGGGLQWQTPYKEIDPSLAVAVNTLVYVSPENALATGGMLDLGGANPGGNTTARSGTWLCVQAVPAQVSNPSGLPAGTYYNVPQLPYPGAGAITGSAGSIKGDLDGANVFWVFISQTPQC